VPAEYVGKDVAVVALDSMLAAYYEGKQIALHKISYQRKDMVVNPQHYRRLTFDKRQIDELATMRFLENAENVVFLGPPGVGKTHLTSALGLVAA
jgi:DNA replication protein DnaC